MTVWSAGKDYKSCAVAFPRGPPPSSPRLDLLNCWNPAAGQTSRFRDPRPNYMIAGASATQRSGWPPPRAMRRPSPRHRPGTLSRSPREAAPRSRCSSNWRLQPRHGRGHSANTCHYTQRPVWRQCSITPRAPRPVDGTGPRRLVTVQRTTSVSRPLPEWGITRRPIRRPHLAAWRVWSCIFSSSGWCE